MDQETGVELMQLERLLTLDPREVIIRFETGTKSVGVLYLTNLLQSIPVAFKIQTSVSKKYVINPPHAVIEPLGVARVEICMNPQNELPDPRSFPHCPDKFTVKSTVVPAGYTSENYCSSFSLDWFTAKNTNANFFMDTSLRIALVGGGILRSLIARGRTSEAREVLERDAVVANATDENGETAMHVAISMSKPECVLLLLEFKVHLEKHNRAGQTPLQQAAQAGEALITELLLASGARTEARNESGWTALHYATVRGHVEVVRLLIHYGADVDAAIGDGRAPLHMAVAEGHKQCLELLLENGCNVDARAHDGGTALHTASARGCVSFVKLLLDNGASAEVVNLRGNTPYDDAADSGQALLYDMLFLGDSLRQSARKGDLQSVREFVNFGAEIDGQDQHGWTALHQAAFKGRVNVVQYLLAMGADLRHRDVEGYTALHAAAASGQRDVVKLLLMKGANVDDKTGSGLTALDVATNLNHMDVSGILAEGGAGMRGMTGFDYDCWEFASATVDSPKRYDDEVSAGYLSDELDVDVEYE